MNPEKRRKGVLRAERISKMWDSQGIPLSLENCKRLVATPTPCSCPMCGNPRKYFGYVTIQEKRSNDDFNEQLKDVA